MPVSSDLRMIVGRLDAAIAGGDTYKRVDLDRLRRELELAAEDARRLETRAIAQSCAFGEVLGTLEDRLADMTSAVQSGRRRQAAHAIDRAADLEPVA